MQKPDHKAGPKLKTGKEEIVYLLNAVFDQYEARTGHEVVRNTNRRNYEEVARMLSQISNRLPFTAESLGHAPYAPDRNADKLEYPYLRYDITSGQIRDAYNGNVARPRPFIIDACYIYLYGMGRQRFEEHPADPGLLDTRKTAKGRTGRGYERLKNLNRLLLLLLGLSVLLICFFFYRYEGLQRRQTQLQKDLKIVPYQPGPSEIKALEGTWLVYIGSPQARTSDKNRYHQVVTNIMQVKYKNGYFLFTRYGANFDHTGYMEYENADVVSVHSYLKNSSDTISSPRLSLMRLHQPGGLYSVISASWNFDTGRYNDIIGIRELYQKVADSGSVEEIINTLENSACKCKIVRWHHGDSTRSFYLKNVPLESVADARVRPYVDEKSILAREPGKPLVLARDSTAQ